MKFTYSNTESVGDVYETKTYEIEDCSIREITDFILFMEITIEQNRENKGETN